MGSSKPDGDKPAAAKAGADEPSRAKSGARCPICTAPTELAFRPFCSRRCADVDLSRWLRGAYAVPSHADTDEDGDDSSIAATGGERRRSEKEDEEE